MAARFEPNLKNNEGKSMILRQTFKKTREINDFERNLQKPHENT